MKNLFIILLTSLFVFSCNEKPQALSSPEQNESKALSSSKQEELFSEQKESNQEIDESQSSKTIDSPGCYDTVVYFGKIYQLCDYEALEVGDQIGILKEYYEDGEILWEQSWLKGSIRLGLWTKYFRSGKKWYEGHYNEGVKVGDWTEWHPDGRIKQVETYTSVNNSTLKKFAYHSNYEVSITQEYKVYQNNSGEMAESRHGKRMYYDEEGNLIKEEIWENGKRVEPEG